jgi:hypothetical protein
MKNLDFIIIGAQKSATTSLFKYLQPHPDIFMPSNKEAPFFSSDSLYKAGWESFVKDYFDGAGDDQRWGTASPQYMGDPRVPERIHAMMPDTKLIALLRNPVERAYSHYTMSTRRGFDNRSFDDAVEDLRKDEALKAARDKMPELEQGKTHEDESGHYLVWGEYGRILSQFLDYFPQDQLLVLFMDEMIQDPVTTYKRVIEFIGIVDDFVPQNVGKVYHKGGTQQIIPDSWRTMIKTNSLFRLFWDRVPDRIRNNVRYWYDQKNVKTGSGEDAPSMQARQMLIDHFAQDVEQLEKIIGRAVPWPEFQSHA